MAVPYFQRLQREGESGRRKINQITRYLTLLILVIQAPSYLANLHAQIPPEGFAMQGVWFIIQSTIILTAGTMFVMWLGERITDNGYRKWHLSDYYDRVLLLAYLALLFKSLVLV